MAVMLSDQKHFRQLQRLPFCYNCGQSFLDPKLEVTRDHIPAQGLFDIAFRTNVLWLPAHKECNSRWSKTDQCLAELLRLPDPDAPPPRMIKPVVAVGAAGDSTMLAVPFDFVGQITRWVRGFHVALYQERMAEGVVGHLYSPWPSSATPDVSTATIDSREERIGFAQCLWAQRKSGDVDCVKCYGSACEYFCYWTSVGSRSRCVWALRIDGMSRVSSDDEWRGGCVGYYECDKTPSSASVKSPRRPAFCPADLTNPFVT